MTNQPTVSPDQTDRMIGPRSQTADVMRYPVYRLNPDPVQREQGRRSVLDGFVTQWTRWIYGRRYRFYHSTTRSRGVYVSACPWDGRPGVQHELSFPRSEP